MTTLQEAIAAHKQGSLDKAEALYCDFLAHNARDFDALHMLGILNAQRGRFNAAEELFRNALSVSNNFPPCLHNYGNVLSKLKQYEKAISIYKQALALAPSYAPIYFELGNAQSALGKFQDAVESYERALTINPNASEVLANLAHALVQLGQYDEAAEGLRRSLLLIPNDPQSLTLMAQLAYRRGKLDEALDHIQRTLALKPDQSDAYNIWGCVLMVQGRLPEARQAYEKAVALDPAATGCYVDLAESKTFTPGDEHLVAMEALAGQSNGLSNLDRFQLDFALGKAYADIKDYRRSFQHFLAANAGKRAITAYDEKAEFDLFERIEQVFSRELIASKLGNGVPSRRPIFIVGMPRSGTTLIEQVLASHPAVFSAGELETLNQIVKVIGGLQRYPMFIPQLSGAALGKIGVEYLKYLETLPQAERITDKMPSNFYFVGLIHLALPEAVIIHSMRDPVDTCVSCFTKLFMTGQHHTYDLSELGRYYRRYRHLMEHWRRVLPPGRILDVCYEDLISNFEEQARRLVAHCGLPWDERCLAFYETSRPVNTTSAAQVRQPVYSAAVGRWHVYKEYLGPLLTELNK
jgi:Flp pilus assembly protein TadD